MTQNKKKQHHGATHGAYSVTVRQRYSDLRTNEGKALDQSIKNLIEDLGGPEALTAPMRILIDSAIRPKLITLAIIGSYIDNQAEDLINEAGELIPCLGANYLAYSNGLRRDLESLNNMAAQAGKAPRGIPSIDELISAGKE